MKKSQANRRLFLLMAATLCIFLAVAIAAPQSVNGQSSDPMGTPMTVDATQVPAATLAPVADTTQYPLTQPDQMGQMGGSMMGSGSMDMTSCPMMSGTMTGSAMTGSGMMMGSGSMGSTAGMGGMTGMSMQGMGSMQGGMNMTGMQTGIGSASSIFSTNPWWLLGWVLVGLVGLVILVGLIVAIFWLIRRLAPVKTSQSS